MLSRPLVHLLMFIFLCTLIHSCTSQRPDYNLTIFQRNRGFWLSSSAPMTNAVNAFTPELIPDIQLILYHAERVENAVMKKITERGATEPDDIIRPCNRQISPGWRGSIRRRFGFMGLLAPATSCAVEVGGVHLEPGDEPGYTLNDLYDAVFHRAEAMQTRLREITNRVIDNFTSPHIPFNFTFDTTSLRCTQSPACLFRQGEHWYTELSIHSIGKDEQVRDGHDISVLEFMRVVNQKLGDNLRLWQPVYDNGTVERVIRNDTTAMIQRWESAPNPSCFREILMTENPAVLDAMSKADPSAQQAEDALTNSNLAILMLPLGLNLIPIAFFADVNTMAMVLYTLMRNVLTVIPLAIKGTELKIMARKRFQSVIVRMTTEEIGNGARPVSVGGEMVIS